MRAVVQLVAVLQFARNIEACQPNKCSSTTCYILPPSPPMFPSAPPSYAMPPPMYAMASSAMLPPPPPPLPPPPPMPVSLPASYSHQSSSMMVATQTPFVAPLEPPIVSISSSAASNSYEVAPTQEMSRWDRQEPEYKHVEEAEAVVAPDVVVADAVDENSTNSEKVEKVHENERLARMDLKYEEPEPTPFDNGTVTFHAWFF
ncbi:unnamed protein product [Caenorhabditis sp. 36 PRJEB53466]|nr:unnamed protein product [Caenorhabditis sp. 36 PRJEB53466]